MPITTPEWVKEAVFYQIFPDRFAQSQRVDKPSNLEAWDAPPTNYGFKGGDLLGVAERLDYLQELGVTALYFTPVFSSTANHRYHTFDYYSVDPILGGNAALRELLDQAHARGMRVVLDGVFNHASRGFYPFNHALENGARSPYLDWFHFNPKWLKAGRPIEAYPPRRKKRDKRSGLDSLGYCAWWGLPALPKLNTGTPAVRRFIMDVAKFWIDFGIDGWRLDVPSEIDDDSFWQEFRQVVKTANPQAYLVGELWGDARRWLQGDQFDAVMNYLFTKAVLGCFVGQGLDFQELRRAGDYRTVRPIGVERFARRIHDLLALYEPAVTHAQLNLLDSHDTPRFITTARGDESALRLAVLYMLTYPGAPCIYYGDEIGLEGRHDPDCRRGFPWDEARWNHELLAYFRQCIALRHAHPALRRGSYRTLLSKGEVYAFARQLPGSETVVVALNLGRQACRVDLPLKSVLGEGTVLKNAWGQASYAVTRGKLRELKLAPRSGLVLI
ncbi:MAG: glycoside hydrolase family 13 protein [Thermoflexales bacterium]|nr:glycoside hydrolase family 13 protein [Thermoflexales bacterium]